MQSLYVVEKANLEATAATVEAIDEKLSDVSFDFVIGHSQDNALTFNSVEDFALCLSRKLKLLRNDRVLYFTQDDSFELIGVILRQLYKDLTGDAEFPVSEVIEVHKKLGDPDELEDLDETDVSFVRKARKMYKETMKKSNLVDGWMLAELVKKHKDLLAKMLKDKTFLLVLNGSWNGPSKALARALFEDAKKIIKVQVELPLDASLNGHSDFDLHLEPWPFSDLDQLSSNGTEDNDRPSNTERFCEVLVLSSVKLLINSREELSLARVLCSSGSCLDHKAFFAIKNESSSSKMPLYQTVVSYVQKVKLGGKSYAPKSDHPFNPYTKDLTDFVDLMNKLHSKLEDEPTGEKALIRILASLKSFFMKTLKQSSVENVNERLLERYNLAQKRWNSFHLGDENQTNAAALDNATAIKIMVDEVATSLRSASSPHVLLGKIEPNEIIGRTPISLPNVLKMYRTPSLESEEKPSDQCNSDVTIELNKGAQTPRSFLKEGRPRFDATMAWAAETSPLILNSADRNVRTSGPTLSVLAEGAMPESPKLSDKIRKGIQEAEEALVEAKNGVRPAGKPKAKKRTILAELKNAEKWEKMINDKEPKKAENKKARLDIQGQENDVASQQVKSGAATKKKPGGQPKKAKQPPPLLKGQTKMTAFFRL